MQSGSSQIRKMKAEKHIIEVIKSRQTVRNTGDILGKTDHPVNTKIYVEIIAYMD